MITITRRDERETHPYDPALKDGGFLVCDGEATPMVVCPACDLPVPVDRYPDHFHDHAMLAKGAK